jgi:hypothetical protein
MSNNKSSLLPSRFFIVFIFLGKKITPPLPPPSRAIVKVDFLKKPIGF